MKGEMFRAQVPLSKGFASLFLLRVTWALLSSTRAPDLCSSLGKWFGASHFSMSFLGSFSKAASSGGTAPVLGMWSECLCLFLPPPGLLVIPT